MASEKTYYEVNSAGYLGHVGHLYKWDESGNHEITIHKTEPCDTESEATDTILEWAEDNGYDPQL